VFRPRRPLTPAALAIAPLNALWSLSVGGVYTFESSARTSRLLVGVQQFHLDGVSVGIVLMVLGAVILAGVISGFPEIAAIGCIAAGLAWITVGLTLPGADSTQTLAAPLWPVYIGLINIISAMALMNYQGE
jgi:hypothetical protein